MNEDRNKRLLGKIAGKLHKGKGMARLTPDQAQKAFETTSDIRLASSEVDSIVDQALSGELAVWSPTPSDAEAADLATEGVKEDVYQLNRNLGEADPESEKLLEELRRKALEDKGNGGDSKDSSGLGGTTEPPGKGD
jgi:hypothetical protein